MLISTQQVVYSVAEITGSIKTILEGKYRFVSIRGEVSNLQTPYSGHSYFVLKDKSAQIRAVIFKNQKRFLLTELKNGRKIICHGRISLYEPRGEYQLIIDTIEDDGLGSLQQQFEEQKKRFAKLGYFAEKRKQELPFFAKRIALITSPSGAAVHDFLRSQKQAGSVASVIIIPVRVQGEGAAGEIARAISKGNQLEKIDVIALCRGGGTIEDLWAFNEEVVVQAIVDSRLPVVTGIGHEIDYTLADFTADFRAATPTAAGQQLALEVSTLREGVEKESLRLQRQFIKSIEQKQSRVGFYQQLLTRFEERVDHLRLLHVMQEDAFLHTHRKVSRLRQERYEQLVRRLLAVSPEQNLKAKRHQLTLLRQRLEVVAERLLHLRKAAFAEQLAHFQAVGPLATLARGYAIATKGNGQVVQRSSQLAVGENMTVRLEHGSLEVEVITIIP